jgi:hypothetical protein
VPTSLAALLCEREFAAIRAQLENGLGDNAFRALMSEAARRSSSGSSIRAVIRLSCCRTPMTRQWRRVRAENLVRNCDQQSCPSGRPAMMITDHVPAVRLPPDHVTDLMAAAISA